MIFLIGGIITNQMKKHFSNAKEFSFIVRTDTVVSSSCCTSLDYIVTYLFKHIAKEGKKPLRCREATQAGQRLLHFMQQNPDVLQQVTGGQSPGLRNRLGPECLSEQMVRSGLFTSYSGGGFSQKTGLRTSPRTAHPQEVSQLFILLQ